MKKYIYYLGGMYSFSTIILYFLFFLIFISNEETIVPYILRETIPLIELLFFYISILLYCLFLISKVKNKIFLKLKNIKIDKLSLIILLINNILTIHFFLNPYIILPFLD